MTPKEVELGEISHLPANGVKTSPPSARVAAMSDMQQKTSKTEQPHKSLKLLLNTLPLS